MRFHGSFRALSKENLTRRLGVAVHIELYEILCAEMQSWGWCPPRYTVSRVWRTFENIEGLNNRARVMPMRRRLHIPLLCPGISEKVAILKSMVTDLESK